MSSVLFERLALYCLFEVAFVVNLQRSYQACESDAHVSFTNRSSKQWGDKWRDNGAVGNDAVPSINDSSTVFKVSV